MNIKHTKHLQKDNTGKGGGGGGGGGGERVPIMSLDASEFFVF